MADIDDLDHANYSPPRIPRHSANPFGNEGFEILRRGIAAAERLDEKPTQEPAEPTSPLPTTEDMRSREIGALRADVAALRVSLARLETIVSNLTRVRT